MVDSRFRLLKWGVGKLTVTFAQSGLLGLVLLAVGNQVPQASNFAQNAESFALPSRSVQTTSSENSSPDLLSGTSRVKSIPRPDSPFAIAATAGVPFHPETGDRLPGGGAVVLLFDHSCAHSGRAPPSA